MDRCNPQFHILASRNVGGVNFDLGRYEMVRRYLLFYPLDHVVAGAAVVVSKIVVQADLRHLTCSQ